MSGMPLMPLWRNLSNVNMNVGLGAQAGVGGGQGKGGGGEYSQIVEVLFLYVYMLGTTFNNYNYVTIASFVYFLMPV